MYGDIIMDIFFQEPSLDVIQSYSGNFRKYGVFIDNKPRIVLFIYLDRFPVYTYLGQFRLEAFHNKEMSDGLELKPDWCDCDHTDDLLMTFGEPFVHYKKIKNPKFTDKEKKLSEIMMKYFTNFAKNG